MNIIYKVTWQYMKKSRRRVLVTLVGVIISVAMITAVTTAGDSFADMMRQSAIESEGKWHVIYRNVPAENADMIIEDERTESYMLSTDVGYDTMETIRNPLAPYLFVRAYDTNDDAMLPITVVEGRKPKHSGEIMIPENMKTDGVADWHIGDTVSLQLGKRMCRDENGQLYEVASDASVIEKDEDSDGEFLEPLGETKTYTVVGIMKSPSFNINVPGYLLITALDIDHLDAWAQSKINISVWENQIQSDFYTYAEDLGKRAGIEGGDVRCNYFVLQTYKKISTSDRLYAVVEKMSILLIVIIGVCSVSMIYNAFAIAVTERGKQLGLLAGIGATKSQKRQSVYFETFLMGIVGIPAGILAGVGGMGITFKMVSPMLKKVLETEAELRLIVNFPAMAASAVLAAVTLFVSAYIPAKRASKLSPMDSIRLSTEVKLTKKQVKTSAVTKKIFGIEGELALKSMKRNQRRYRATVISLIVTLVLFISVSVLVDTAGKIAKTTIEDVNYQFEIYGDPKILEDCAAMEGIQEQVTLYHSFNEMLVPAKDIKMHEDYREMLDIYYENIGASEEYATQVVNDNPWNIHVVGMADDDLKQFMADEGLQGGLDEDEAILLNQIVFNSGIQAKVPMADASVGEILKFYPVITGQSGEAIVSTMEESCALEFRLAAVTDAFPIGVTAKNNDTKTINIIVSKAGLDAMNEKLDMYSRISDPAVVSPGSYMEQLYINAENPEMFLEKLEAYKRQLGSDKYMGMYSQYQEYRNRMYNITIAAVFTYGFLVLMACICLANILNTTSTSIELRRSEFAMLKSVGMTPESFRRMIIYESLFYGMKAALYGVPMGLIVSVAVYKIAGGAVYLRYSLPVAFVVIGVAAVLLMTGVSMLYAFSKIKKDNIIEMLR